MTKDHGCITEFKVNKIHSGIEIKNSYGSSKTMLKASQNKRRFSVGV